MAEQNCNRMTREEYRTSAGMATHRTCSVAGCDGKHKGRGLCAKHYIKMRNAELASGAERKAKPDSRKHCTCKKCGKSFKPKATDRQTFCSRQCSFDYKAKLEKPLSSKVSSGYCLRCGKPYCKAGTSQYCSDKCSSEAQKQRNRIKARDAYALANGALKTCSHCSAKFVPVFTGGKRSSYCSTECRKASLAVIKKIAKRISKALRRARSKSVDCERVDPFKVFERDRWRCMLCGISTPKTKRGTYSDNAPELDHIVPLSKGGAHTYKNTQCACRKCNGVKSDKPLGQLLMFG